MALVKQVCMVERVEFSSVGGDQAELVLFAAIILYCTYIYKSFVKN